MSNSISVEALNAPFNVDEYHRQSELAQKAGRTLLKMGVMMWIQYEDRLLVLKHEARDGLWRQGALGPSMETARYLEGDFAHLVCESPMQAWQRSLDEELGMDANDVSDAGFFLTKGYVAVRNNWNVGRLNGYDDAFYSGISVAVGVENPDVIGNALRRRGGRTEEVIGFDFVLPSSVLGSENTRPGFIPWTEEMMTQYGLGKSGLERQLYIEPVPLPTELGKDVRFAD